MRAACVDEIPVVLVLRRCLEIQNGGRKTGSTLDLERYMYLNLQTC